MSKIKLVAMDLDGTVLNSDKQISNHTREVFEQATSQGIYIVPCTGRIIKTVPDFLKNIKGVRYFICSNGAAVYDGVENKIVYSNYMDTDVVFQVLNQLEGYHCTEDIYRNGQGYMERKYLDNLTDYGIEGHLLKLVTDSRDPVDNLREYIKENPEQIEKICIFFDDMHQRQEVLDKLNGLGTVNATTSLANNIEVMEKTCNKGDGLYHLAKYLGLSMDEVMACGDAGNDTEMIKVAGLGVVMENGNESLKEQANYITKTNDEDGVAYAVEKFVL